MSDKYKREIEEILKQAGEIAVPEKKRQPKTSLWRLIWRNITRSLGGKMWSLSPSRVMLIAVVLFLLSMVFRATGLGIVGPLAWAGLLLFIIGYAMFFIRPKKVEKLWRGQPIDITGETLWNRIRRKLKK